MTGKIHSNKAPSKPIVNPSSHLGNTYALKRVIWRNRRECCGAQNADIDILVGNEDPEDYPLTNRNNFVLCGRWPYRGINGAISGVTCDCLSVGTTVVIYKNESGGSLNLAEVKVHGILYKDLIAK